MQGSLKQVPLPEVLQFISLGKSSGILRLSRGRNEITLTIDTGKIINSSAIERRRKIGELLVYKGLLKRSELSRLLNIQRTVESDKRLGTILVERDIVTQETIRETLRMQLEEEIWNLFGWTEGEFFFDATDRDRLGDAIVQIDIEPLILEGTRRNDEWQKIQTILPNDLVVLKATGLDPRFQRTLKLRPAEWQVLSNVNGEFTVRAIVNRSTLGRFEVHLILSQFLKTGLLSIVGQRTEGPASRPETYVEEMEREDMQRHSPSSSAAVDKPKGGLLASLMGSRSRDRGSDSKAPINVISPIGALALVATELARRLIDTREGTRQPGDDTLIERSWGDLVQLYTRADLIHAEGNKIDCSALEKHLAACDFSESIDECYEDAVEALQMLIHTICGVMAKRAGERFVGKVARDVVDDLEERIKLQYRAPFPLAERLTGLYRVNA